jgi:hypothetical protein
MRVCLQCAFAFLCVLICVFMFVCVSARACPCVYACLCERMCAFSCVSIGLHLRARVCSERVRAPRSCMRPPHRIAVTCGINSSARAARRRLRASAAGDTWTSRTANARWAARSGHTSVVDAAGAIYVIGGDGGYGRTNRQDVWASTDGGARPDSVQGMVGGCTRWVLRGTKG